MNRKNFDILGGELGVPGSTFWMKILLSAALFGTLHGELQAQDSGKKQSIKKGDSMNVVDPRFGQSDEDKMTYDYMISSNIAFEGAPRLDNIPGFSQQEFDSLEAFIKKLDNSVDARKIRLELKKPGYNALKNFLFFVDQQFGFQFLMMDEVAADSDVKPDGYDKEVNFYKTYKELMTKLLGPKSVKSVAELEASAQSDMATFFDQQYGRVLSEYDPKTGKGIDGLVQFFDIAGKYFQEVRYTSSPGVDGGWKTSSSSMNAATILQKALKGKKMNLHNEFPVDIVGPIVMSKEIDQLHQLIANAGSPERVMESTSRFRFLHALDVFAKSVDNISHTIADKRKALNALSKKLQYITDVDVILTDGKTNAKDFLTTKLLHLAKQNDVIADADFSKAIDNFLDDLNYESHAYGLTMTVEDGVDHAEIVWAAEQVAKGNRIEYLGYLDYTENIKRLDSKRNGESLIPDQIRQYYVASELDLSRLSYMDSSSAQNLVDAINQNPHIESVIFNAMLLKDRLGNNRLIGVFDQFKTINKDVTVIVGRDGLGYKGLSYDSPLLSTLAAPDAHIRSLTVLTDAFQSEKDMNQLSLFPGSLSLPRLIDTPLDDPSTKSFVKTWADNHSGKSLELGFIKTSNVLPEAIDLHGKEGQTYSLSRLQELQVDGGSPLSYTQANVLLPSQKDIPNDLLAIGDRKTKTSVDIADRKEKKKSRIEKDAGVYDFSGMGVDKQKAKDIRTYFRGNELTIQKPSDDEALADVVQAKNLTRLHLVGGSAPSPDAVRDMNEKGYVEELGLQGVDISALATDDYRDAFSDYERLTTTSDASTVLNKEQWNNLMQFGGELVIDQPLTINLQDLGDALEDSHPRKLVLKNWKAMIIKDSEGNDKILTADDYYKARDSYSTGKKDKKGYDLVDFFQVLRDNRVDIDFADGADQYPAVLYQEYLRQK